MQIDFMPSRPLLNQSYLKLTWCSIFSHWHKCHLSARRGATYRQISDKMRDKSQFASFAADVTKLASFLVSPDPNPPHGWRRDIWPYAVLPSDILPSTVCSKWCTRMLFFSVLSVIWGANSKLIGSVLNVILSNCQFVQ